MLLAYLEYVVQLHEGAVLQEGAHDKRCVSISCCWYGIKTHLYAPTIYLTYWFLIMDVFHLLTCTFILFFFFFLLLSENVPQKAQR